MQPHYLDEKITYLNEQERALYEIKVGADGLIYDHNDKLFDTTRVHRLDDQGSTRVTRRGIFVVTLDGHWLASTEQKAGVFHHSSFVAGDRVLVPGTIEVPHGELTALTLESGHYLPEPHRLTVFLHSLKRKGIALGRVRVEMAGIGDSLSRINPSVKALDYMTYVNATALTAHDALAALVEGVKGPDLPPLLVAALFNRPYHSGGAPETYPESYAPRVFEALKQVVRDPATRAHMVQALVEGTTAGAGYYWEVSPRAGWYNRRSPELDQALFELANELPDASAKLMKVLSRRKSAGVIPEESPLWPLIPDVVVNESYGY